MEQNTYNFTMWQNTILPRMRALTHSPVDPIHYELSKFRYDHGTRQI